MLLLSLNLRFLATMEISLDGQPNLALDKNCTAVAIVLLSYTHAQNLKSAEGSNGRSWRLQQS